MLANDDVLDRVRRAGPDTLDTLLAATRQPVTARERLARLAIGALVARRDGLAADVGNLYGGAAGPAEMLAAFDTLVRDTPLVRFAHLAANGAHLDTIGAAPAVRIVDIGLGSGLQWDALLRALGRRPGGAPRVELVGIDLPGPDPTSALEAVGRRLATVAADAGVPFVFRALPGRIEDVALPAARPGEVLTVNAAFALHHTGPADRDRTLRRLADTGADAIVLCEPEADHDAPAFPDRVGAALHHYGLVFEVLDRSLGAHPEARAVIEGQFFGRELHNVLVGEGSGRVERHAPAADWARRLRRVGLHARPATPPAVEALDLPVGVQVVRAGDACALTVDGHPLVVVSAWTRLKAPRSTASPA